MKINKWLTEPNLFYLGVQVKEKEMIFRNYDAMERLTESVFPLTQMVYI